MFEKIKTLIREKDTCVLATAAGGEPHCSLMSYVADDDCLAIYMVSLKGTRKYRNLITNAHVSLLIDTREENAGGDRRDVKALTVKGVFQMIDDDQMKMRILKRLLDRHPQLREFAGHPEVDVFQVKTVSFELLEGVSQAHYVDVV